MLGEIANSKKRIYTLSFHVDYWNRLGWKDPFSHSDFSKRQRRYAQVLDDHRVYTPQMIVNGTDGFVGSYRAKAKESVETVLSLEADVVLDLAVEHTDGDIVVGYTLDKLPSDSVLNLALVERDLRIEVPRGENAGRSLEHHNVVRVFRQVSPKLNGQVEIEIAKGINLRKTRVIGYVQNQKTMKVVSAAEAEFTVTTSN